MDRFGTGRAARLLVLFASLAFAAGCSGEGRQVVRGTVSLDGRPLPAGVVQFHGANGRLATAVIQADGTFTATDLLPGEVKVAVVEDIMAMPKGKGRIPGKYRDAATSGLSYTITPSTDSLDIKLLTPK